MSETPDEYFDYYRDYHGFWKLSRPRLARYGVAAGVLTERAAGGEGSPDNGLTAIAERRLFVLT